MNLRIELFVKDIERTVVFYRDVLGFRVPENLHQGYVSIHKGNTVIGLGEMGQLSEDHPLRATDEERIGLGVEIVLEVDDIHEIYQQVVDKGYPIKSELTERPWGLVDFRVADPDGYYIRLTSK